MDGIDLLYKTALLQYDKDDVCAILKKHGKTLGMLQKYVEDIRKWAQKEYVTSVPYDRKIASLLIFNDFSVEKTKTALDMNYALKSFMPEFFVMLPKDRKFIQFATAHNLFPLPKLTENKTRIFISQAVNPQFFDADGYVTLTLQIFELLSIYDFNNGVEWIIDYELFTENVLRDLSLDKLKKMYLFLEKVYSRKILPIHGVNLSDEVIKFLKLCQKNLLKPGEPLFSHKKQGYEALYEFYSKDVLPKDYGGNLKTLAEYREEWIDFLQENNDYLDEMHNAEISENLRIKEIKEKEFLKFKRNIGQ